MARPRHRADWTDFSRAPVRLSNNRHRTYADFPRIGPAGGRGSASCARAAVAETSLPRIELMKADLHIHSRASNRSAEWLFRRAGFPESLTDPTALYDVLRAAGMDFVTITDHDSIDGCLAIADRPGVFLGEQVTSHFPDDRCKIHVLVWGHTEAQHRELGKLRGNVFDLQRYLADQKLTHAVAHPLFDPEERLNLSHVEQLILLFQHFEGLNGLREDLLNDVLRHTLASLTATKVDEMANRHGFAPTHSTPWKKFLIGGSDDHGGMFPARAYSETPAATSTGEFLAHVRDGRIVTCGSGGSPLTLSHSLYNTAWEFAKEKFLSGKGKTPALVEKAISRFLEGKDPTVFSLTDKLGFLAQSVLDGKIFELVKPGNVSAWRELSAYFSEPAVKAALARETAGVSEPERRAFIIANLFTNQLAFRFFTKFLKQLSGGNVIEAVQAISAIVPLGLLLSPYIYAIMSQAPNRRRLREITEPIAGQVPPMLQNTKRGWFTDTLEDVNGVATTIQRMVAAGHAAGRDLRIVTSRPPLDFGPEIPIQNFKPIGEFEIPEYELQKLTFPPILEMIDYIQRERFTELIISTPGPIGLTALLAARLLGLPTSGIYHTDIPYYVQILTDDHFMESLTWNFMSWFYHQFDVVYVNSERYREIWIDRGIPAEKLKILPRGVATELFTPAKRDPKYWTRRGAMPGQFIVLYVGRISVEKQLDLFAACVGRLRDQGLPVRAAVVGDGLYKRELKKLLPNAIFTGILSGEELARAYASADAFLFPSVTDTYGNVIVEAQSSGLPVIVSDEGGPRELVEHGKTGLITRGLDLDELCAAVERLLKDELLRAALSANGRKAVDARGWDQAFPRFWAGSENL